MNKELYLVFIPALAGLLFALGGSQISDTIKGQKWVRRFLLPFALLLPCVWIEFSWWQGLLVSLIACFVLHLGYGDKATWVKRALIFTGYGLISIPIGYSMWNIFTAIGCLLIMWLSRVGMPKTFVWKVCEFSFGALIGIQVAFLLM